MSGKEFTARVFVSGSSANGAGETNLSFNADYADDRNKEWAKFTPALSLSMTVLDVVAEGIEYGDKYELVFRKLED